MSLFLEKETDVLISDVVPRDELHSVNTCIQIGQKKYWISAFPRAGVQQNEAASRVLADSLSELTDSSKMERHVLALLGQLVRALVPNLRGGEPTMLASEHKLGLSMCAGEPCSMEMNLGHDKNDVTCHEGK